MSSGKSFSGIFFLDFLHPVWCSASKTTSQIQKPIPRHFCSPKPQLGTPGTVNTLTLHAYMAVVVPHIRELRICNLQSVPQSLVRIALQPTSRLLPFPLASDITRSGVPTALTSMFPCSPSGYI